MIRGKLAVVTGSTSGIGLGVARKLAASGVDVVPMRSPAQRCRSKAAGPHVDERRHG